LLSKSPVQESPSPPTPTLLTSQICNDMSAILSHMRRDSTPDARHQLYSIRLVESLFNHSSFSLQSRTMLWADFTEYEDLCLALNVPSFPISPTKVALFLARYVELPCSDYLRWLAPTGLGEDRYDGARLVAMLRTAAHATALFWSPCPSFLAGPYPVVEEVLSARVRRDTSL
jgi:hypothetical protein